MGRPCFPVNLNEDLMQMQCIRSSFHFFYSPLSSSSIAFSFFSFFRPRHSSDQSSYHARIHRAICMFPYVFTHVDCYIPYSTIYLYLYICGYTQPDVDLCEQFDWVFPSGPSRQNVKSKRQVGECDKLSTSNVIFSYPIYIHVYLYACI